MSNFKLTLGKSQIKSFNSASPRFKGSKIIAISDLMQYIELKIFNQNLFQSSGINIDLTQRNATAIGLDLTGAALALKKNIEKYPTYDLLQHKHSLDFRVKEKLHELI